MSCIDLVQVWIEAMFSLLSISKVEIEITAHGQALSHGHNGPCGTGGSRRGLLSFWLAVSLNVSAAQPELCRATACITAVTCMGGLWEMERFQLKRAALVLSVWRRRGAESRRAAVGTKAQRRRDESCVTDCSLVNSTLCVAVPRQISLWKGIMSACQSNPTWCLPPALVVGFCSRGQCVLWKKWTKSQKHKHWNSDCFSTCHSARMLRDLKVLSWNAKQSRDRMMCHS